MGREAYTFLRYGITHSLAGMLVLSLSLAALFRIYSPLKKFQTLLLLSLAGMAVHLVLDILTSWGIPPFAPFSGRRLRLCWVADFDLWLWAIPATGIGLSLLIRSWTVAINRAGLAALAGYILFCGMGNATAKVRFRETLARLGVRPVRLTAFATHKSPARWNVVAWLPRGYYQGDVHMMRGLKGRIRLFFEREAPPWADAVFIERYREWAAAPLTRLVTGKGEAAEHGPAVALYDLRFAGDPRGVPHVVRLDRTGPGAARREWFPLTAPPSADQEFELP